MNWLFLRGLSREQRHWGGFPELFAREVPGARVHALDLPGAGTEHRRASPLTVRAIADDVRRRWLALQAAQSSVGAPPGEPGCAPTPPGDWALLGVSLGGMVAMQWCADHPGDFARLVLVNSSAGDLSRPWRRMDPRVLPAVARALTTGDPLTRERLVLSITTRLLADPEPVAARWVRIAAERPIARALVLRQLVAATRFRAPAALALPTLILGGGRDPLADPSCARRLAEHFRAPLEVHPDAGHELALDAPEWLARRVAAWVAPSAPQPIEGRAP